MVCPLDGGPDIAQARRWICSRYTWRLSVSWRSSGWCFRWFMTVGPNDWYLFIMILLKSEIQRQGSEIWVFFINWIWFRFLSKAWFSRGSMGPFRGSSHLCARRHQKVLHYSSDVKHGPHQNTAIDRTCHWWVPSGVPTSNFAQKVGPILRTSKGTHSENAFQDHEVIRQMQCNWVLGHL